MKSITINNVDSLVSASQCSDLFTFFYSSQTANEMERYFDAYNQVNGYLGKIDTIVINLTHLYVRQESKMTMFAERLKSIHDFLIKDERQNNMPFICILVEHYVAVEILSKTIEILIANGKHFNKYYFDFALYNTDEFFSNNFNKQIINVIDTQFSLLRDNNVDYFLFRFGRDSMSRGTFYKFVGISVINQLLNKFPTLTILQVESNDDMIFPIRRKIGGFIYHSIDFVTNYARGVTYRSACETGMNYDLMRYRNEKLKELFNKCKMTFLLCCKRINKNKDLNEIYFNADIRKLIIKLLNKIRYEESTLLPLLKSGLIHNE